MTTSTVDTKEEKLLAHTNQRLLDWYANAKREYGVIGSGFAQFNDANEVEISYEENGIKCLFVHYYHEDFRANTIFDMWSTESNIPEDSNRYQEYLTRN